MTDLEKLLRESLDEAGESYQPARTAEARRAFLRRARRRRLYAGGSVVLAGAALVALLLVVSASDLDMPTHDRADTPTGIASAQVTARVEVGDGPQGVAVTAGSVWVANTGDGTLARIDPSTDRVVDTVDVGGAPSEVAVAGGSVWVAFEDQPRLVAVDVASLAQEPVELEGEGTNLDLAPSGDFLWVVSPDTPLQRVDSDTGQTIEQTLSVDRPVDVAAGGGKVWVLGAEGAIDQIDERSGLGPETTLELDAPVSPTASDLAFDGLSLWVSDGDTRTIVRIDPQAGVVTSEVDFQGRWADLAASGGRVWALVGNDSTEGSLLLLDGGTGRLAAGAIGIPGEPVDIGARGGSVWAVGSSSNRVTRIDLTSKGSSGTPVVAGERLPEDEIVYLYDHLSDLIAAEAVPSGRFLTRTPEAEANPSFISDDTIVFERTDPVTNEVTVVTHDLATGTEEVTPVSGTELATGPEGRAAWVMTKDDPGEQTRIRIGSLNGSGRAFFIGNPEFEPLLARNLEWDASGEELYYEAGSDGMGLYVVDRESLEVRAIDPPDAGATYLAPSAGREEELVVLRFCCGDAGGYGSVELGRLSTGGGPPEYSKIAGLDDAGFNPSAELVTVEYAGRLDVEETPQGRIWSQASERSWIVSDGATAWLVDEQAEIDRLPPTGVTGVAVNPELLD